MKIAKFVFVGSFKTLFCYLLYVLLVKCGLHYNLALALDYFIGIIIGYILNRDWTFAGHGIPRLRFIKYLITYIGAFLLNVILLTFLVEFDWLGPIIGQIVVLGIVTVISFILQNYWVFRSHSQKTI